MAGEGGEIAVHFESLPWWDWLTLSAEELRILGKDPTKRVVYTGHIQPFNKTWALSIGMWGGVATPGMIKGQTGHAGSTYGNFRHRWALFTARNAKSRLHPYAVASAVMTEMSALIEQGHQKGGAAQQLWQAGARIAEETRTRKVHSYEVCPWIGVLPIEYVLYYEVMSHVLEYHDLTLEQFQDPAYNDTDYKVIWTRSDPPTVKLPWEVARMFREDQHRDT